MRIAIAGAGAVGRSIAAELVDASHDVMLIERFARQFEPQTVEAADWVLGDACEMSTLEEASLQDCDVVIAATGDDKVNLVLSLLAKEEFGVARVVARVNHPSNEWLFTEKWGVDVAVSTPRIMAALVEEATGLGHLVRLMTLRQGKANLVEMTVAAGSPLDGVLVGDLRVPDGATLVALLSGTDVTVPQATDRLKPADELLFISTVEAEQEIKRTFGGP